MKNKIEDLRNHLFATLESLRDEEKPMDLRSRARDRRCRARHCGLSEGGGAVPQRDRSCRGHGIHDAARGRADARVPTSQCRVGRPAACLT